MASSITKDNLSKGLLYAGSTALMWGFLAILLKVALNYVNAITLAWFRFAIAFVILTTILAIRDRKKLNLLKKPPKRAVLAGIALGFNYVGFITGIDHTTASNAQIFIQTGPLLLALSGIAIFKEKLSALQLTGFLIAIGGFAVFFNEQLRSLISEDQSEYITGSLMVIGAAISWACYAALQKSLVARYNPQSLNIVLFAVPGFMLLPFIDYSVFTELSFSTWLIVVFLGLNTVLAYGALAEAFQYIEANKVAIVITLNPIITIITMSVFAYMQVEFIEPEVISLVGIVGALMVITGAILAVKR